MAPLERTRARLEARLAEVTDHRELAAIGEELARAAGALAGLEEQWLDLGAQIEDRS